MTIVRPFRSRLLLPKQLPFTDPVERRFFYCYRRSGALAVADPLGAGNSALIAALGVTPWTFHDVRSLGTPGAIASFPDVSGVDALYGGALTQATGTKQPTWDGTTLNFSAASVQLLVSAALAGLDMSAALTLILVAAVTPPGSSTVNAMSVGASGGGAPRVLVVVTATGTAESVLSPTSGSSVAVDSVAIHDGATVRLMLAQVLTPATNAQATFEQPTHALVSGSASGSTDASGSRVLSLGATATGTNPATMKYRASLVLPGGYTTAQRDAVKTWATTYHLAALA